MILSVHYLRALAAFMVLLHHVEFKLHRLDGNPLAGLTAADIGVDVFFVISGFVMTHSVRDRHGQPGAVREFLLGRVARIIPLYWAVTLVALAVFVAAPQLVNSSGGRTLVLPSFLLLPTDGKYLVQNGWTLSFEFYFYLLFSAALLMPRQAGRWAVACALLLLAGAGLALRPQATWPAFLLDPIIAEFAVGMLIYGAWERGIRLPPVPAFALAAAAAAGWLVVNAGHRTGLRIVDYAPWAALLFAAVVLRRGAEQRPAIGWLAHLGDTSYALYLVHPFVIAPIVVVAARLPFAVPGWLGAIVMVPLSLAAAAVVFRRVEQPLVRASRSWLGLSRRAPRAGRSVPAG